MKRLAAALAVVIGLGVPALAGGEEEKGHGHGKMHEHGHAGHEHPAGLAALMLDIRGHFAGLVDKAFFTSVLRQLQEEDFQVIAHEAEEIAGYAEKAKESFSLGKDFDHLAHELDEHAGKVQKAAAKGDLPRVNVEIGEMAEYCAKCHNAFRW